MKVIHLAYSPRASLPRGSKTLVARRHERALRVTLIRRPLDSGRRHLLRHDARPLAIPQFPRFAVAVVVVVDRDDERRNPRAVVSRTVYDANE